MGDYELAAELKAWRDWAEQKTLVLRHLDDATGDVVFDPRKPQPTLPDAKLRELVDLTTAVAEIGNLMAERRDRLGGLPSGHVGSMTVDKEGLQDAVSEPCPRCAAPAGVACAPPHGVHSERFPMPAWAAETVRDAARDAGVDPPAWVGETLQEPPDLYEAARQKGMLYDASFDFEPVQVAYADTVVLRYQVGTNQWIKALSVSLDRPVGESTLMNLMVVGVRVSGLELDLTLFHPQGADETCLVEEWPDHRFGQVLGIPLLAFLNEPDGFQERTCRALVVPRQVLLIGQVVEVLVRHCVRTPQHWVAGSTPVDDAAASASRGRLPFSVSAHVDTDELDPRALQTMMEEMLLQAAMSGAVGGPFEGMITDEVTALRNEKRVPEFSFLDPEYKRTLTVLGAVPLYLDERTGDLLVDSEEVKAHVKTLLTPDPE